MKSFKNLYTDFSVKEKENFLSLNPKKCSDLPEKMSAIQILKK